MEGARPRGAVHSEIRGSTGYLVISNPAMRARQCGTAKASRIARVMALCEIASAIAENAPLTLRAVKLGVRAAHQRDEPSMTAARAAVLRARAAPITSRDKN